MAPPRPDTRTNILAAAEKLAREVGPGNISLEAVASAAGVSKGGLLYHFPSKGKLLEALVASFVDEVDRAMALAEADKRQNGLIAAYIDHMICERRENMPPPTGLLAALAEHPQLLDPVRRFEQQFLEKARRNSSDPQMTVVAFLVVQAIRSMELLDSNVLSEAEIDETLRWVLERLPIDQTAKAEKAA
jgi:AcrR family transcriptional regulator